MQYYAHREKMRTVGREDDVEKINRVALKMAREVATDTGTLMAGGVCNTNIYVPGDKEKEAEIRQMFTNQVLSKREREREGESMCAYTMIHSHKWERKRNNKTR